ncbi:MAG: hypothetical protein RLZZ297_1875 [Chloroflexota bacterium]
MAQHQSSEVILVPEDNFDRVALFLSKLFSPLFGFLAGYGIAVFAADNPRSALWWAGLSMLIQIMPVLVLYRFRMRQGRYSDPDMSRRSDRNEVYALGAVSMLTAVVVMRYYGAPLAIVQLALDFFLIGAVCGVVNVWWKISMHASAIAAVATIATMQSRSLGIVLWLTAAAVAWARLHTRNHTPGQVAAGTILATVVVYAVHRYMV